MSLGDLTEPFAVLAAVREFDELGRERFLAKYGFGPARTYFLRLGDRLYDSKAVVGAAHGVQFPEQGPLAASVFSGGEATVARKLQELGFRVAQPPVSRTSQELVVGKVYTRAQLMERFQINDATIRTGTFKPKGHASVWLFVTEQKSPDRTPYVDRLAGDVLHWQGQLAGRTDRLVIEHEARGLELLVFYRHQRSEFPGGGFRYEGPFRYEQHAEGRPTSFVLRRVDDGLVQRKDEARSPRLDPEHAAATARLLAAIRRLPGWQRGEWTADKPLLALLAFERVRRGLPRLTPFTEIEEPLRDMLDALWPRSDGAHPEHPFWLLQKDGLWEVHAAEPLPSRRDSTCPPAAALRSSGAHGGFHAEFYDLLQARPDVLDRAVEATLEHLPPADRASALAYTGWEGTAGPSRPTTEHGAVPFGLPYRPEDEDILSTSQALSQIDPDKVGRGLRGHRSTRRRLAEALEALGITPLEPNRGEPLYDLAWETANAIFVAEVKSLTVVNEERQLRLGLGQVFRYRQLLEHHSKPVIAVLMAERQPADDSWTTLCQSLGVCLLWPAILPEALFVDLHSS